MLWHSKRHLGFYSSGPASPWPSLLSWLPDIISTNYKVERSWGNIVSCLWNSLNNNDGFLRRTKKDLLNFALFSITFMCIWFLCLQQLIWCCLADSFVSPAWNISSNHLWIIHNVNVWGSERLSRLFQLSYNPPFWQFFVNHIPSTANKKDLQLQ